MAMVRRTITKEEADYLFSFNYKSKIGSGGVYFAYEGEEEVLPSYVMIDEEEQFYMFYDIGLGDGKRGIPMYFGFVHKDILGYLGVYEELEAVDDNGIERTDVIYKVVEYYYPNENEQERHDVIGLINQALVLFAKRYDDEEIINDVDVISFVVGDWNEYYG